MHAPAAPALDLLLGRDLSHMRDKVAKFNARADEHERLAGHWRTGAALLPEASSERAKLVAIADGYLSLAHEYTAQAFRLAGSIDAVERHAHQGSR